MARSKDILQAVRGSTTLKTALITSAVIGFSMVIMQEATEYADRQSPQFVRENDRWRVLGAGYSINQAQIDPTIVSILRESSLSLDRRNGLDRGKEELYSLCPPSMVQIIHEVPGSSMHVRIDQVEDCLKPKN